MPLRVLTSPELDVEVSARTAGTPFALRNVFADELHIVVGGSATVETELGVLAVEKDDVVLIPRSISYRLVDIEGTLQEVVFHSGKALLCAQRVGVGPLTRLTTPAPWADAAYRAGEHETVFRHGDETTSVYTPYDPLPTLTVAGDALVQKINMKDLLSIDIPGGAVFPQLLFGDDATQTMVYDMSSRIGERPPVHYNSDYDECILFLAGPGTWGAIDRPGLMTHTPKGFPHRGPDENVPDGYRAFLIETRSNLSATRIGDSISTLAETDQFSVHPSETAAGSFLQSV